MADQRKYTNKLQDKHVLIIGGSAGIGFGVAEASLESGAHVTISSSNPSRLSSAVNKLKAAYPSAADRISSHACDIGNEDTIEKNVAGLFETVGSIDHVVYSAGDALATTPLRETSFAQMKQTGLVRFFGPLIAAKEAAKYLVSGPASSFTITSGSVAERPLPDWAVVGSFAGGLASMARGLALDLKPIRVNLINPGVVDTELWRMPEEQKRAIFKGYEEKMPTGRVGRVEDVAEAYLYCMKDQNLTGSVISTNGGSLLVG
ncbi:uncharacterized protein K452DRAFT_328396 [Aplosporella prunicola CBS 121167]|uniref:Ketoreductase (KR) domain-containing protein n=1 Tax=Aplosporella prunicola CBS 121167 TaxID=1176127 RepID=A0A6A6B8F0_9PEZI|nr:uncharacterized protein K452DRAFT_328396 [Aplosporella prunicola CBS 121167]KAF2139061.1 hypothetical protein K452DRAFT_328396 [Aplosporella prunicola CBS 121167]